MTPANPEPLTYMEARTSLHRIAQQLRDGEEELEAAAQLKADAQAEFHKIRAKSFLRRKAEGYTDTGAVSLRNGDAADAEAALMRAEGRYKLAFERLENRRGDRASMHKLADWARELNPTGEQTRRRAA